MSEISGEEVDYGSFASIANPDYRFGSFMDSTLDFSFQFSVRSTLILINLNNSQFSYFNYYIK